jgi:hypothetical protein
MKPPFPSWGSVADQFDASPRSRLTPGVLVHFHDMVLPLDYSSDFGDTYWNEQYILDAYQLGTADRVRILMPTRHFFAKEDSQ